MGKRGPKPTPSAQLKRRGSWRAELNPREPVPDPARPTCPRWLDKTARSAWRELCPQLHSMGVLAKLDRTVLAQYCVAFSVWRRAVESVDQLGPMIVESDDEGKVTKARPNPAVWIVKSFSQELAKLGAELGLSPSARSRIVARVPFVEEPEETTPGKVLGKGRFFGTGS